MSRAAVRNLDTEAHRPATFHGDNPEQALFQPVIEQCREGALPPWTSGSHRSAPRERLLSRRQVEPHGSSKGTIYWAQHSERLVRHTWAMGRGSMLIRSTSRNPTLGGGMIGQL
ncbi:hypothetical protein BaRGS_00013011 [Batillaria attramentaria]|uniref:Uncharacterized protein n=1 Tax=Batillaria attramentaria TaxID=370345 RepID=A0ABD0L8B0_9CAEN